VYTTRNSLYGTLGLDRVLSGPEARTKDVESVGRKALTAVLLPTACEVKMPIFPDTEQGNIDFQANECFKDIANVTNMACIQCGNKDGKSKTLPMPVPGYTICIEHAYWRDIHAELPEMMTMIMSHVLT
jgi:hypothetical protein